MNMDLIKLRLFHSVLQRTFVEMAVVIYQTFVDDIMTLMTLMTFVEMAVVKMTKYTGIFELFVPLYCP